VKYNVSKGGCCVLIASERSLKERVFNFFSYELNECVVHYGISSVFVALLVRLLHSVLAFCDSFIVRFLLTRVSTVSGKRIRLVVLT